jgi:glycosyltransferase involved in cell wall biosynthesis
VPVYTLYNSIDLDRFAPQGDTVDLDTLGGFPPSPPGTVRIGLVATFARWKGHEIFIEAIGRLRALRPVRAYVIGAPIYTTRNSQFTLEELRHLVAARGLTGTVGFTGRIDDIASAMRSLDIVVHASTEREPFGLVIAEAMACGRPIVVSRAGGAGEIAKGIALFHTPGNAAELADCLNQLADDASLRAAIGRAGREAAIRLFSRRQLVETLVPVYETLVSAGHARESTARS